MSATLQIIILLLAFLVYTDAMNQTRTSTSGQTVRSKSNKVQLTAPSLSDYDNEAHNVQESPKKKLKTKKTSKSKAIAAKPIVELVEQPSTPLMEEAAVPTVSMDSAMEEGGNAVESNADSMVPEHAESSGMDQAENAEAVGMEHETALAVPADPQSQHAELLEMNDVLQWEMATRSEDEQVLDLEGDLEGFTVLIFQKLGKFLQNVPSSGEYTNVTEELAKMVENWKQSVQPIDVDQETRQLFEVENSLDKLDEQLTEQNLAGIKATPAVLDIVLDIIKNDVHEEEKLEFMWKMVNRKATHYVKNLGQLLGGISIAIKYLDQVVFVGKWALDNSFLSTEQFEQLLEVVRENQDKLNAIQQGVASKMGINLGQIGINELLGQNVPSLVNIFTQNLANNLAKIKETAQLEEVQISDKQIGSLFVSIALITANDEVEKLEDEIVGTQLTWPLFKGVGDVSKAAQMLKQMKI
ncbi:hypothetical protein niasHT_001523 [Heterodera trifolii]|uniref:Uncharacterized protein n=1 Tax=Heterodera trifolii TaxID=157864 RepID=A0ABD2M464_9BILA